MREMNSGMRRRVLTFFSVLCVLIYVVSAMAAPGDVIQTTNTPMELPIEVEIELSPAGSLKQAPLWKELIQLLRDPYSPVVRRPGFGVVMPPLNVYPLDYNFLTGQPLRLRTTDGEISWDQPGPLFDPAEPVPTDAFSTPTALRTVIGALVGSDDDILDAGEVDGTLPCSTCGYLLVSNPTGHLAIPPDGTIVAVPAVVGGVLQELVTPGDTETEDVAELEIPINEEDFFADRNAAEVLGKALFWDMQVGSDSVQACGTCHFHAGVDNRTKNQLNPNHLGGDITLQVKGPNQDVIQSDFPFHRLADPSIAGEAASCGFPGLPACSGNVVSDANDVMSSMGVIFRTFVDIPTPGPGAFGPVANGVASLLPDIGIANADPLGQVFQGLRRVEPRNTPTFHGAAFNFDNFWDGRARFLFNGGSVFGQADPQFHVFIDNGGVLEGASNGHLRPDLIVEDPEVAEQPLRIKFSSLASQAVGPPLSDFEMSFAGRNWPKIGKKLLQTGVVPLANQLVSTTDSVLGPYSNQGGSLCPAGTTAPDKPGLCISYPELIQMAFHSEFWQNASQHLAGAPAPCISALNGVLDPPGCDPFDGYVVSIAGGSAGATNTNEFNQMEANFSLFFGLAVQAYEELTIPDDTPADRFFDLNPNAGHGVGEPGDQAVLFPTLIPDLVDDGLLNNSALFPTTGILTLIPDDPSTPEYDGFGPDEIFGFDLFSGANLTAALPTGSPRNPLGFGSNPFTRSAKCMLCHLGPEQTDHSINIAHGLLKNDAEFEYPTPPFALDPGAPDNCFFLDCLLPAPEPSGSSRVVGGLILAEEVEETAQDAVEVEPRNFATFDDPATPWDDRVVAQPGNFAFGDQGIYNIGVRPSAEDPGRGGNDNFGWPLSMAALTLKNIGGPDFEPCDGPGDSCVMANFDPSDLGATFEETGGGFFFPGTTYEQDSINPGFERSPIIPLMPEHMAPWINGLPAGELHPQIDEMAGMVPNTLTPPNGGPAIEFPEIMFGADGHCALYDPVSLGGQFSDGPPTFGWGPPTPFVGPNPCPNNQSGVTNNFAFPVHGTWPVPNRVLRDGAFKAPPLRNVELTGPYFHTGSYLTLRQVIDFYMRGGDFPITNAANRDPHIVEIEDQAFSFGRTTGADLNAPVNHVFSVNPPFTLVGSFADGLPDTVFLYDEYPDSDQALTPEPTFASRDAALEDAKSALVKFLLALTDPRVKYERAPFDRPEIFVPVDGRAPDNTGGRPFLMGLPGTVPPGVSTFSISGTVTTAGRAGTPLAGVTVTLGGASAAVTLTDANGAYIFSGLGNGAYTITPSFAGFTFTPVMRAVSVSGFNLTAQNFTGSPVAGPVSAGVAGAVISQTTHSISGTVTLAGRGATPIAGVTMSLSGAATAVTTTDANGMYTFSGLGDGSYTVMPFMTGFTFTPPSRAVTVTGADVAGQDFLGSPGAGAPAPAASMFRHIPAVGAGGNPAALPNFLGVSSVQGSPGLDHFDASAAVAPGPAFSISGTITMAGRGGAPIAGVTVTLSGTASAVTVTDGSGNYSFGGLASGNYTVTPSQAGFTFTPPSRAVTVSGVNVTGQNFTRN